MDTHGSDKNKQIIATLAVLVVVVLIVIGTKVYNSGSENTVADTTSLQTGSSTTSSTGNVGSTTSANSSSTYKDGTYSATGTYSSPGGLQEIGVSVTISNGTVTSTTATDKATDRDSQEFQDDFIAGYKSLVVGKSLDSISLSRVSGSSLTSQGFNNAITQIKEQAKV